VIPGIPCVVQAPDYASHDQVIDRQARWRGGKLRSLQFFVDWGYEWSIWDSRDGALEHLDGIGVSGELQRKLQTWYQDFVSGHGQGEEWLNTSLRRAWKQRGEELFADVCYELWPRADVRPMFRNQ
jgi:hypothetical protein